MSRNGDAWGQDHDGDGVGPIPSVAGRGERWSLQEEATGRGRLHVRIIERIALVHFLDSEVLFEEAVVRAVGDRLDRLIAGGETRLLLNFAGVRYLSCALLGRLAGLQKESDRIGGRLQLCGLDPLLQEMLRITHLDRVFDVCCDEANALGLILSHESHRDI